MGDRDSIGRTVVTRRHGSGSGTRSRSCGEIDSDGGGASSSSRGVVRTHRHRVLTACCITSIECFVLKGASDNLFGFVFSSFEIIEELRVTGLHFDHVFKATSLEIIDISRGLSDYGSSTDSDDGKRNGSTDHDERQRECGMWLID